MSDTMREYADWREDVWPRFKWAYAVDAIRLRTKEVDAGDVFPDGYGLAWRCWDRDAVVCMPVPLNAVCGWLRWFWMELRHGARVRPASYDVALHAAVADAFDRGRARLEENRTRAREDGYRDGWAEGRAALISEMLADLERDRLRSAP